MVKAVGDIPECFSPNENTQNPYGPQRLIFLDNPSVALKVARAGGAHEADAAINSADA